MVSSDVNMEKSGLEIANNPPFEKEGKQKSEPEEEKSTYKTRMEFAAFLFYFGVNLAFAAFQDEVIYLSCTVVYGYNGSVCDDVRMGKGKTDPQILAVENLVQAVTANIFMTEAFIKAIVPAILALFIGSWTDKFGRKPLILAASIGYLCYSVIKIIIATLSTIISINPWLYLIASIPLSICGGDACLITAMYCYVTDLTTVRERPIRLCIMTAAIAFSGIIGQMASGYLYEATNAWTVFSISAATKVIGILFIVFMTKESVSKDQLSTESKVKGFYDGQLLKEMFRTLIKKRPHFETAVMWCTIMLIVIVSFDNDGIGDLHFLYLRKTFGWNVEEVTLYNACGLVIKYTTATVGTYFLQYKLRIRLTVMALIVFGSSLLLPIFLGTAFSPWYLYAGEFITSFSGVAIPLSQAMLSNAVPASDIGKTFTFVSAIQGLAPLVAGPAFTFIYNSTLATFPSAFYFIGVGLYAICMVMVVFIHVVDLYYPKINVGKRKLMI